MDANDPSDDPKASISCIFTETDLLNLHHRCYPSLKKPMTHQRGSKVIDLMAGSPLAVSAVIHAWMSPFGYPAMIKGVHRLLGIEFDPDILFGNCTTSLAAFGQ